MGLIFLRNKSDSLIYTSVALNGTRLFLIDITDCLNLALDWLLTFSDLLLRLLFMLNIFFTLFILEFNMRFKFLLSVSAIPLKAVRCVLGRKINSINWLIDKTIGRLELRVSLRRLCFTRCRWRFFLNLIMFHLISNHKKAFLDSKHTSNKSMPYEYRLFLRLPYVHYWVEFSNENMLAGFSRILPIPQHVFIFPYSSILF